MNFIKSVLSSLVALGMFTVLLVLIIVGVVAASANDVVKEVSENSVLEINLKGELLDYKPSKINPLESLGLSGEKSYGFNNVCKAIAKATYDSKIKGISLRNIPNNIGWAQVSALRKMLQKFKQQQKFVFAYDDVYSQKNYYLNSVADSLFMSPLGYIELKGLHSEVLFYKDFQDKYGVKMEVIRHGKYKSAVEPYLANQLSKANREQISELILGVWGTVEKSIGKSRNIDVNNAVECLYGISSDSSLKNNLVDGVLYEDQYQDLLVGNKNKRNKIELKDYMSNMALTNLTTNETKVAVVYAQGDIIYGEGDLKVIGQKKIIGAINDAAEDENVKSIVLRINSPGGSALASDLIWRAVVNAKKEKPVVVSMGNLAASGGYYIACAADKIYAEPTTITGSIGVFGLLPNAAGLSKKIGINSEVVSTHNNGIYYSVVQPVDDRFKKAVKIGIEKVYDDFLEKVSKGRNMTIAEVDAIAQGRVWTGVDALKNGLVDELGGLDAAILFAAQEAGIKEYSLKELPEYEMNLREALSVGPLLQSKLGWQQFFSKKASQQIEQTSHLFNQQGIYAIAPFSLEIK